MRRLTNPDAFYEDKDKKLFKYSLWKMCPENSYIRQFRVKIAESVVWISDNSALNRIEMKCYDNENKITRYFNQKHINNKQVFSNNIFNCYRHKNKSLIY